MYRHLFEYIYKYIYIHQLVFLQIEIISFWQIKWVKKQSSYGFHSKHNKILGKALENYLNLLKN